MASLWTVLCVCMLAGAALAGEHLELTPDFHRDVLSLNGRWQALAEHGDEELFKADVAAKVKGWRDVEIPGGLLPAVKRKGAAKIKHAWARRTFTLTKAQAARGAVLRWGDLRYGPTVWINEKPLGHYAPIGPGAMLIPPGMLAAGENQLVIKVQGWAGLPRGKAGFPLVPTGAGTQRWGGKSVRIGDDIHLEFYDRAHLKWVLAMPDVAAKTVTFRIWLDSASALPENVELTAKVRPAGGKRFTASARVSAAGGDGYTDLTVALKTVKPWTPKTPELYVAEVSAATGKKLCDKVRFTFGMREIEVKGGRYRLNDKPLWLRGSNLVNEWHWGGRDAHIDRNAKRYIVDEARRMSLNSFRTHTSPPPTKWLDIADRHGTMILAEFPVLYNHRDYKFTPEELKIWHANAMLDATGWVTKLWNHPSIVVWVLVNESKRDRKWESGEYWRYVRGLDPTRPCMRTGDRYGTPETVDIHTCTAFRELSEGSTINVFKAAAARRDPKRTLSNTEYMNRLAPRKITSIRWLGKDDAAASHRLKAEFAAEWTEAMRRLQFDCILPYMYAGWTGMRNRRPWREEFPSMMAAALHSSMSPVLASLDLFDRNYPVGKMVTTPLALINEEHETVSARLVVYVTPKDPLNVPDADALKASIYRHEYKLTLAADSLVEKKITWPAPKEEGVYYLAAVLHRKGARPVVSQRQVQTVDPAVSVAGVKRPGVTVLGGDATITGFLKSHGFEHSAGLTNGKVNGEVAVLWGQKSLAAMGAETEQAVVDFAKGGGKVLILNQHRWRGRINRNEKDPIEWTWKKLADFSLMQRESSRAHIFAKAAKHSMFTNVPKELLWRWNCLPGVVADRFIQGPAVKKGKPLAWIENPQRPVAVSLPLGKGEVIISTLVFTRRVNPRSPYRDLAAERVLLNMIGR